ncbi:hypothetical protein NDU88_000609 [Pleurodeles waltl]|uniref:Uncharacterized protein n=1 Tax=Pleurodeles waltl TaxID=8319 RepID=A0AAV7SXS9_PLEWA|nr:hypothetical protein NDU88_000609 [Pleurodeles waltl]
MPTRGAWQSTGVLKRRGCPALAPRGDQAGLGVNSTYCSFRGAAGRKAKTLEIRAQADTSEMEENTFVANMSQTKDRILAPSPGLS